MAGLWRNNPETREGKYPVVLRRDGTVPETEWMVLLQHDRAAPAALFAYAGEAEDLGWDSEYVSDVRALAFQWVESQRANDATASAATSPTSVVGPLVEAIVSDPPARRHRVDDPAVLAFPSSLAEHDRRVLGPIDHRELLVKYMTHLVENTYLSPMFYSEEGPDSLFSAEELAELTACSQRAMVKRNDEEDVAGSAVRPPVDERTCTGGST